jgi:hypothetical protein
MYFVIHGGRKERRALIFSGVRGILLWAGDVLFWGGVMCRPLF